MLKRIILVFALMIGAFAVSQGPSQASPLGASAHAESAAPSQIAQAQYYYRRYRPRYFYRPRFYRRRYYRPVYFYRPRYYRRPFYF